MNFDRWSASGRQCVAQGNAVVGQRCRIDDDACRRWAERLNRIDQMALMVGLDVLDPQRWIRTVGQSFKVGHDLGEGRAAVHAGLPGAEQIEVRSIEDEHKVALDWPLGWFARHLWSIRATQLRTGSTIVIRRSSMI